MVFTRPDIIANFSRRPANMSLEYGDTLRTLLNREVFLSGLGIDYRNLVCAAQAHGSSIRIVSAEEKGRGACRCDGAIKETDAFITVTRNIPIAIFTADCLSIFLYDTRAHIIALVHAGWKGTHSLIAAKTVGLMRGHFRSKPDDLLVGFGPSIRACCYEVGTEFKRYFKTAVVERDKRYYLDLIAINKEQLLEAGVRPDAFSDSGICTSCSNSDFFSYRKEGPSCGRIMSVMMLK